MIRVGILGATGYAGHELMRLLKSHPEVTVCKVLSESHKEKSYHELYRSFAGLDSSICGSLDFDHLGEDLDLVFSALPYGILMEHLAPAHLDRTRFIDLSGDYRFMSQEEYLKHYGKEHKSIGLAEHFVYGLSEWNETAIRSARHVANPGCFATAMQLALLPLVRDNLILPDIVVDGKCGLSGAGRTLTQGTHFVEANESTKAYKIDTHPHAQEVKRGIELFTGISPTLTFVPHVVPMQRGMLVTAYATLKRPLDEKSIRDVFLQTYREAPFVTILDPGWYVETKWVRNSNMCHINLVRSAEGERVIILAAIDNLIKGAAGQAIQNMNLMFGHPRTMGLEAVPVCI